MGQGDAWRRGISDASGKTLQDAMESEEEAWEEERGDAGAEGDDDDFEEVKGGWDDIERLERQVEGCLAGVEEHAHKPPDARALRHETVVIDDDSEDQSAGEWEDVSVGAAASQGAVLRRKATLREKKQAQLIHRTHLLCLLGSGCHLSDLCDGPRVRRRWEKIQPAKLLALPSKECVQSVHVRKLLDWFHGRFEVAEMCSVEQETSSSRSPYARVASAVRERMTDALLAKALDKGRGTQVEKTLLLVSLLRHLQLQTRLVAVLQPLHFKLKGVLPQAGGGIKFERIAPRTRIRGAAKTGPNEGKGVAAAAKKKKTMAPSASDQVVAIGGGSLSFTQQQALKRLQQDRAGGSAGADRARVDAVGACHEKGQTQVVASTSFSSAGRAEVADAAGAAGNGTACGKRRKASANEVPAATVAEQATRGAGKQKKVRASKAEQSAKVLPQTDGAGEDTVAVKKKKVLASKAISTAAQQSTKQGRGDDARHKNEGGTNVEGGVDSVDFVDLRETDGCEISLLEQARAGAILAAAAAAGALQNSDLPAQLGRGGTVGKGRGKRVASMALGGPDSGKAVSVEECEYCEYWIEIFLEAKGEQHGAQTDGAEGSAEGGCGRRGGQWLHVDALNDVIDKPCLYWDKGFRLSYIVGISQRDVSDVTRRYVRDWMATEKHRDNQSWWCASLDAFTRKIKGHTFKNRAEQLQASVEERELEEAARKEPLPQNLGAFKNHPIYCIEKHLLRNEVIYPKEPVGMVQGMHKVYYRRCLRQTMTDKQWFKANPPRVIRESEVLSPAKRLSKVARGGKGGRKADGKKAKEDLQDTGAGKEAMGGEDDGLRGHLEQGEDNEGQEGAGEQGEVLLYGEWQTDLYVPPAVVDGVVPKNDKGSWEMWTAAHLPRGAAHVTLPGAEQIARKLGLDFSRALTGFERVRGRAIPVIEGIIVASHHALLIQEAQHEFAETQAQEEAKRRERKALAQWKLLAKVLFTRQEVEARFASVYSRSPVAADCVERRSGREADKAYWSQAEQKGGAGGSGQAQETAGKRISKAGPNAKELATLMTGMGREAGSDSTLTPGGGGGVVGNSISLAVSSRESAGAKGSASEKTRTRKACKENGQKRR